MTWLLIVAAFFAGGYCGWIGKGFREDHQAAKRERDDHWQ